MFPKCLPTWSTIIELEIVHTATASTSVDSMTCSHFSAITTYYKYFVCNVSSEFFQCRRLIGIKHWYDLAPKKNVERRSISPNCAVWFIGFNSWVRLIFYGFKPRSLCKIRHKVMYAIRSSWEHRSIGCFFFFFFF